MKQLLYPDGELDESAAIALLLEDSVLFANSRRYICYSGKVLPETLVLFCNINDVFVAAADALEVTLFELPKLVDLYQKHSYYGVIIWAAQKLGKQPRSRVKQDMQALKLWSAELEQLNANEI